MDKSNIRSADKCDVIIELAKQGVTPEEVAGLTLKNITPEGISINGKLYALSEEGEKALGRYIKKQFRDIQVALYPSKTGGVNLAANLVATIKKYLRREGLTLASVGWTNQKPLKKPEEYPETFQEIANFLKKQGS